MSTTVFCWMSSPVGRLLLSRTGGMLTGLSFQRGAHPATPAPQWQHDPAALADVVAQLEEYFAGARHGFDVALDPAGTVFQQQVWVALQQIPFGETRSYLEVANAVGRPRASRAIGLAVGRNPIAIIIPCHRVIGSNGTLTGFGGGLDTKRFLLELERGAAGSASGRRPR